MRCYPSHLIKRTLAIMLGIYQAIWQGYFDISKGMYWLVGLQLTVEVHAVSFWEGWHSPADEESCTLTEKWARFFGLYEPSEWQIKKRICHPRFSAELPSWVSAWSDKSNAGASISAKFHPSQDIMNGTLDPPVQADNGENTLRQFPKVFIHNGRGT